ncbi:MAG: lipopolysaccharide kinase InaA family protein [Gemmataceae bacterium]
MNGNALSKYQMLAPLYEVVTPVRQKVRADADWIASLGPDWADDIMSVEATDRFHAKQGRSIARWVVPNGPTVYLKRHFVLPRKMGFLARWFPGRNWSPGMQEADRLTWVARQGIFVPRVVAAGEFLGQNSTLQSFIALEELKGMIAVHEAIPQASRTLNSAELAKLKRGMVKEMARLTRQLHSLRAFHKDLYLCHFYVYERDLEQVPDDWTGRIAMIDFHRLGRYNLFWMKWQAKDLAQLLYSTFDVEGITVRDRLRFWKCYYHGDWSGVMRPPGIVKYTATVKAQRYYSHNQKLAASQESGV